MNEIYLSNHNYDTLTNNRYLFKIPNGLKCSKFRVKNANLQYSFYQVPASTIGFTFTFSTPPTVETYYISAGNYSAGNYSVADIITELNAKMVHTRGYLTFTYSAQTGKFSFISEFSSGIGSLTITPANSATQKFLGFTGSYFHGLGTGSPDIAENVAHLLIGNCIYIRNSQFNNNKASINKSAVSNIICKIPITGNEYLYNAINYENTNDLFTVSDRLLNEEMEIYFSFADGTPISLNGGFFDLTLLIL